METTLFSGFELVQTSPQLISSPEIMAEMQHGSHANNVWFIFANVTTSCPICVRYNVHSSFIISSLRPSYARIYPSGREDLLADTFFHTQEGSNLLKSITDDDLITWFGKNDTVGSELRKDLSEECLALTTTKNFEETTTKVAVTTETNDLKTSQTDSNDIPFQPQKIEVLSIATYTINVDNDTMDLENSTTKEDNPTTPPQESTTQPITSTMIIPMVVKDTEDKEAMLESNLIPDLVLDKIKIQKKLPEEKNHQQTEPASNSSEPTDKDKTYMTTVIDTTQETTTKAVEKTTKLPSPPKHVNTDLKDSPIKYLNLAKTTETSKVVFAPENKNDKYVLLDKEEIWSLLKEIVNDPKKYGGSTT